jgi:hypothetical protein
MAQTLEERMQELEKKMSELAAQYGSANKRNWQQTFGLSRDDQGFEEMVRLGQEYRRNLTERDNGAGS